MGSRPLEALGPVDGACVRWKLGLAGKTATANFRRRRSKAVCHITATNGTFIYHRYVTLRTVVKRLLDV